MSEQDKRRGPQGVQGVQGIEGIEGQGSAGARGAQGERGERGKMLPRSIMLSFVIVVALSFVILAGFAWQVRVTRQLAEENRHSVELLCNTTTTLDTAIIVPFLIETKLAIKAAPVGVARARLVRIKQNLAIAHQELSSTSTCEEVR